MTAKQLRVVLMAVAIAAIVFAGIAAFRGDQSVAGVLWSAYLCMALGAVFAALLSREIAP